ncbi:helix-turn-helix domain-containing protein [Pasteurella atlantica]|nr:helix-turn-helix domain-containing protein [Pasteurella atlantica]MDP8032876.1 helix-turn-helix domain-containing protein [Pasteurella atlantica]MDP8034618.1 helix-turn-helix domain-containing protein [Pasteurella atlantica]MDP8036568.1 helix-turn-helix domain-containing protein [Pasteurella atlantica]MDP8047110.1 helix-turn-helix domain-containing protein [Pasteurella atlantica]MDP8049063.1 helix-turn-helix domain-containing protein [Pasteurella atlantica]
MMIIQKLRLERGWSQQQLAEMSGLSTRTIQRIENGKTASNESVKSLASVFEVDFSTLKGALTMKTETLSSSNNSNELILTRDEQLAYQKVRNIKRFYIKLFVFVIVMSILLIINLTATPNSWWVHWVFLGWGLGLIIRGLKTFDWLPPLGVEWEKRQLEKYLNKR